MHELSLEDGRLAFQRSPIAFQQWIDSRPSSLTGSQWRDLLIRAVEVEALEISPPTDFTGAMQQVIQILLTQKNGYSLAYQLYAPLLQDPSELREYRLNPRLVSTWLEQSLLEKEKQATLPAEEVQGILRIRELLLELDPHNMTNILCLIRFSGELGDDDSVKGYTALGCSILSDPFPVSFVEDPYLRRLLGRILELGYAEEWLDLMTALVPCRPQSEHLSWYAWLKHLATYYVPHRLENDAEPLPLEHLWNPQLLAFWKDLFREAQCRGFSLLAQGLHRALTHRNESDPLYLSLQAEVVYLYRLSAQPEEANLILKQILETWSLDRLNQEPAPPQEVVWVLLFQVCPLLCYTTDDQPYIRHYQHKVAQLFSQLVHTRSQSWLSPINPPTRTGSSLRVGYLSNGFHRHSVGYLSYESLACHHSDVISVYGYYYGTPPVSEDPIYHHFKSSESIVAHLEILKQVPESILVVKGIGDLIKLQEAYQIRGGPMDRMRFIPITFFSEDHRAQLQIADLVLDTFPYTGATHTLEALLYMGVPVLTLVGQHYNGRMSYSLLKNLGLEDCITWSQADYIQRGIELSRDPIRLAQLKDFIKTTYPHSPLSDVQDFANQLEKFYLRLCRPQNG
jgi:hypothetical protein